MGKSWREALRTAQASSGRGKGGAISAPKANPFELKYGNTKFETLGKKKAVTVGKPGESRKRGEQIRKETLLREYRQLNKTSTLKDRRFGRGSDDSGTFDRLAKLAKKRDRYALNSDEEDQVDLTHKGRALAEGGMEDYADLFDDADDGDRGHIDAEQVLAGHFGGDREDEQRTKADVMREVIAKSKFFKCERQKVRDENEEIRGDLDAQFDVVRQGLFTTENRRSRNEEDGEDADEYDAAVKSLSFEKRLAATEGKSTEQLEQEALERDYKRQQERLARMRGDDPGEVVAEESSEDRELSRKMRLLKQRIEDSLESLCASEDVDSANSSYAQILSTVRGGTHGAVLVGQCIRERLGRIHKNFSEKVMTGKAFLVKPGPLFLFKLVISLYSTSDLHHVIATPTLLCMLYLLDYARVTKPKHVAFGLMLCELALDFVADSRRFLPEVLNWLASCAELLELGIFNECFLVKQWKVQFDGNSDESLALLCKDFDGISKDAARRKWAELVLKAAEAFGEYPAFSLIFENFVTAVGGVDTEKGNKLSAMVVQSAQTLQPLMLQEHKPVPLPSLEPDLEYDKERSFKRSRRDANPHTEIHRLRNAHKKELRATQRELKKDAKFLARERLQEQKSRDVEYNTRINKLYGSIGNEGAKRQN